MNAVDRILELDELIERLEPARRRRRSIALANGLFDLLHVGHLRYLEAAAAEAELLIVAVNSDCSARALKGPDRPLVPQRERAELVAGFGCVEYVTVFAEHTVEHLLRALRPDVHCKGTDYTPETLPEAGVATELGIRIALVGDRKTPATRDLIRHIRGDEDGRQPQDQR